MLGTYRGLRIKTSNTPWRVHVLSHATLAELRHAVVIFGFLPNNKIDMGDPSVGREKWNVESLNTLWNGEGILLYGNTPTK
jgi:hypothetical protein